MTSTNSETPLAEYFFIAGIESSQVFDEKFQNSVVSPTSPPPVETTIEENEVLETDTAGCPGSSDGPTNGESTTSKRRSRMSFEARKSISSLLGNESITASNRSSATIKFAPPERASMSDADFDSALRKFAFERETFLEEIHFSAGTLSQLPKPKRSKTQRIFGGGDEPNIIKSSVGSIRRRLSTMNSLKRQPSLMRQGTSKHSYFDLILHSSIISYIFMLTLSQASVRTSKRLSGYNSVIPIPQPLHIDPNMHPLKRRYEPVLLDRYPPKGMTDDLKHRSNFPDYIPMFAFPNDINVVSSDERPRSTWHGFAMTNAEGSKMYGICAIVWLPLNEKASEELERQCEEWRKKNMTNEERELAASLGERLAIERAKLSRLLARLPGILQGSDEREILEEEITLVEEKIGLMSDLLRPVRHGAASKIEGLTDGGTGLWIPRAYGILGRDISLTGFWKEWLKAVIVPMTNGAIIRVPPSSPRVGMWQPLERFVVNLCSDASSPIGSATQVEIAIRELRLYARKEASNEVPGWRNVDLYPLFRCLSIPNVITLIEYVLAESRIILLSSHTSMLHLASHALLALIYPLKWSAVFIPVLPVRLIQALEAPCPYIVGIEKRYENVELPDDDFVVVDLDENVIESTAPPTQLPRQQRRKLQALLQLAAQHHTRYGVPVGPPSYARETYPNNMFCSENPSVFSHRPPPSTLSALVTLNSASFGSINSNGNKPLVLNGFLQARNGNSRGSEYQHRPATSSTSGNSRMTSPPSPKISPVSTHFPPPLTPVSDRFPVAPSTPISRSDSGLALQATLREKRSGHFDSSSRRSSSFGFDKFERIAATRRPSQPFLHISTPSSSTLNSDFRATSSYSPSVYAQSTLAASTVMPGLPILPVINSATCQCVEGHILQTSPSDEERSVCSVCDETGHDGDQMLRCSGCSLVAHSRCAPEISIVCPTAFRPDQVRAAFVRCFASLLYTYRRYLCFADHEQRKNGLLYSFNVDGFVKSLPHDSAEFMNVLRNTQGKHPLLTINTDHR
jgi:hypothetical protein